MRDFFLLARFYFTMYRNRITHPNKESWTKIILVLFFSFIFFPMVYQLFYFIFKHFFSVPVIGGLLVSRVLSASYLTFSFMIVTSAVVSAIPVLYLSRDMDFLFCSPLKIESIFTFQYIKIMFEACWMILLMSIPVFAAYSQVMKIDGWQYGFIILAHLPFFAIMASIGIVMTLLLVKFFPAESIRNVAIAISGIFLAVFVVYFRMLQPEKLTGGDLTDVSQFLGNLRTPENPFLPHVMFIKLVQDISARGIFSGIAPFIVYCCAAIIIFIFVIMAAGLWYFDGYGKKGIHKKEKQLSSGYKFKPAGIFVSQLSKDAKYLVRDTSQWIQVVFLVGIVVIYLFNMYKLPEDVMGLKNIIYFLNIGFIGFVLAAIGARFILPVISVEGRAFWTYRSSPTTMKRYVMDKFVAYSIPMVIVGQIVSFISIRILKSDPFINYVTIFSTLMVTIVISGVGAGFGGYFAKFTIKNPEELITGIAGLTYMFVTSLFVGLMLVLEAEPVREYYLTSMVRAKKFMLIQYLPFFALVAVAGIAISAAALWAGIRKLEKIEM